MSHTESQSTEVTLEPLATPSLTSLSTELSSLVARTALSVVSVDARRRGPATGLVFADGVVVTTSHAIEREEGLRVRLPSGALVDATLKGRDPTTDLAVLAAPTDGPSVSWRDHASLVLGELVVAVARPGDVPASTIGILGHLDDAWRTHGGGRIDKWIEGALGLPGGFSGGALAGVDGRVIGLVTTGLVRGRSLAIPGATITRVVASILARGRVMRGFLGIGSQAVRLPEAFEVKAGQRSALMVMSVQPDGPAEKGGVMLGDLVVALDGHATTDVGTLVGLLDEDRIGRHVTLKLVRAGELRELEVAVGARSLS